MDLEQLLAAIRALDEAGRKQVLENLGQSDIQKLLNKIREDEKNKSRSEVENLRTQLEQAQKALKEQPQAPQTGSSDSAMQALKDQNAALAAQITQLANTFAEETKRQQLTIAKERAIAAYKGDILPDLVTGSTEAEIEQSAFAAHTRFKELQSSFESQFKEKYKVNETQTTEQQATQQASTQTQTGQTAVTPQAGQTAAPPVISGVAPDVAKLLSSVMTPEQLNVFNQAQTLLAAQQTAQPALGVTPQGQQAAQQATGIPQTIAVDPVMAALQQAQQAQAPASPSSILNVHNRGRAPIVGNTAQQQAQAVMPSINPAMSPAGTQSMQDPNAILQRANSDPAFYAQNRDTVMALLRQQGA